MKKPTFLLIGAIAALLVGCGQPDGESREGAGVAAGLDMTQPPNKVTSDDYALAVVPTGGRSVNSVDSNGNVAPFGMASRAPRDVAPAPAMAAAGTTEDASVASLSTVYANNCVACHGANAKGVQGLGVDLTMSQLVADSSQAELVAFLKIGRMPDSPDSVSGVPMPAFSWLPQADLDQVAADLKSL